MSKLTAFQRRWSSSRFQIIEHTLPAQHTRQWLRGRNLGTHDPFRLAVKQYIPVDNPKPSPGDITFIGLHANGLPKELYEPLWSDLADKLHTAHGRKIRSIWIADIANQGQSAILNQHVLGNDPSWFDFSRDLLFMINQKQADLPSPLVGIGHSVGGAQLAHLGLFHPSLFQALVLIDPTIQTDNPGKGFVAASTFRRDTWPSRRVAREKFRGSKFYSAWDERVLERWVEYGLRDVPPKEHEGRDHEDGPAVTLATTVAQEVFLYQRPKQLDASREDNSEYSDLHPDDDEADYPFYRPEPAQIFRRLPELHPPVLYIFGSKSPISTPDSRSAKLEATGTGVGGSGGQKRGQVEEVLIDGGHMLPFEKVDDTAYAIAQFTGRKIGQWETKMREEEEPWLQRPDAEQIGLDDRWKEMVNQILEADKREKEH